MKKILTFLFVLILLPSLYFLGTWQQVLGQSFSLWFPDASTDEPTYVLDVTDGCASWSSNVLTSLGVACGSGSGSGTTAVSTSTNETAGRLSYWTSSSATPALLGEVATTTLTAGTGISSSATHGTLVGGANTTFAIDFTEFDTDSVDEGATNLFNVTHTGEVTGATALTIASGVVDSDNIVNDSILEIDLDTTNAAGDNQILSFDSASGGFTWVNDATGGGDGLATSTDIADTYVIYGTSADDVGAEAAFTYDDATDRLTVVYASTTAFSSPYASSTNLFAGTLTLTTPLTNANVADALTISSSGSVDSTALTDGGTIGFDWVDAEIADTLTVSGGTVTWSVLDSYPTGCTNQFVRSIGDTLTCASVASADITNDTIVNEDINSSAAIDYSKLSLTDSIVEADLDATNAAGDNQILSFDNASGGFTWVDDETGEGGSFAWTPDTYAGVGVNATSTGLWLKATSPFSLVASSTFATNASSTQFTNTGSTWLPSLTSALIVTGSDGLLAEYAGDTCTNQLVEDIDAAGNTTCVTVDANYIDEASIEGAIDTLANLTSIQSLTVTLADAGADAILGWDDTAGAYENLTAAEALAIIGGAANDFDANGDVTIAIADISDLGANVGTWLGTPSSANLASAVTGETGTGALVFGTSPSFTTGFTTPQAIFSGGTTDVTTVSNEHFNISPNGTGRVGIASSTPMSLFGVAGTTTAQTLNIDNPNHTGTSTLYIYSSTSGFGGEIILEDSDGAGCTSITTLNGNVSGITVTCPTAPVAN